MYTYTQGHSRLLGTGVYLPEQKMSSSDIMQQIDSRNRYDLPYEWLERATGIRERRATPHGMRPSDMASKAALQALEQSGVLATEVDAIIYAGVARDYIEPATAHIIQNKIGARNALALDVSNACLGFMSAMHLMDALIATGQVRRGLIVTGEPGYSYTEKAIRKLKETNDRDVFNQLVAGLTLGDAGAAAIMAPKISPDSGFMGFMMQSHSEFHDLCICGNNEQEDILLTRIPDIVRETALRVGPVYDALMKKLAWQPHELDRYIPHQVGMKTLKMHAGVAKVSSDIIPKTVDYLGNIVSATIPVNLQLLSAQQKLHSGEKIYLSGTGSGIAIGQAGIIWDAA